MHWENKAWQRFEGKGGVVFTVMRRQGKSSEVNNNLQWQTKEVMKHGRNFKNSHALRSQENVPATLAHYGHWNYNDGSVCAN